MTFVPRAGSSTKTTSPRIDCAWSVIETVPNPVESSKDTASCSTVYRLPTRNQSEFLNVVIVIHTDKGSKKLRSACEAYRGVWLANGQWPCSRSYPKQRLHFASQVEECSEKNWNICIRRPANHEE